jgi:rhodanese-related sulfurtransferase
MLLTRHPDSNHATEWISDATEKAFHDWQNRVPLVKLERAFKQGLRMATTAAGLVKAAKAVIKEIDCTSARALVGGDTVFIDVREPPEWQDGTISGALCVPRGVLEWRAETEEILKNKSVPVIIYCKSGGRSALAARTLEELGFENVKSLAGGYDAWTGA